MSTEENTPLLNTVDLDTSDQNRQGDVKLIPSNLFRQCIGFSYMILSCLFLSTSEISAKISSDSYSFWSIVILKNAGQLISSLLYCKQHNVSMKSTLSDNIYLSGKGVLNSVSSLLFYFALAKLPFSFIKTIFFINPLLTYILSLITFTESFVLSDMISKAVGFIGVVIAAAPWNIDENEYDVYKIGTMAVIISSILYSVSSTLNKKVSKGTNNMVHEIYDSSFACIVAFSGASITNDPINIKLDYILVCLISVSVFAIASQMLSNKGLQFISSESASLVKSLELVFASIAGFFILNETIGLDVVIGTIIVVCSSLAQGLINMIHKRIPQLPGL